MTLFPYTTLFRSPPKVKVFTFLHLKNRLLTHDIMARRRMHCQPRCVMCEACTLETAHHLFFRCRYATAVWRELARSKGREVLSVGFSVQQTWEKSFENNSGAMQRKQWATLFMCTLWNLWKQRNDKVFSDKMKHPKILVQLILHEERLWMRYCTGSVSREGIG